MFIQKYYKYKINEIIYVAENVPEGASIIEMMDILNAEKGYSLVRISDNENIGSSIWLHNGDVKENYKETEENDG